jgi:transcriptional regulator with XRE-family HTH domain
MGIGRRIKEARESRGLSQTKLAGKIHSAQTTISSWETGRTEPTRDDVVRIADALDWDIAQLELPSAPVIGRGVVPLVGYVGAGAAAHYYASADEGLGEVEAPEDATPQTVAVEIRGESLGALFESWLVYYDDVRSPVTPDLYNRLCVVGLPDGRVLVKRIRKARTEGLFHLDSNTEATMNDQEILWAARVKTMRPR